MIPDKNIARYKNLVLILIAIAVPLSAQSMLLDPSPVFMGRIPVTSSQTEEILIFNSSIKTLNIESIGVTGDAADNFTVVDSPTPIAINAFEFSAIQVKYAPTEVGEDRALLHLNTGTETRTDTLYGFGTKTVGVPTFERFLGGRIILTTVESRNEVRRVVQAPDGGFLVLAFTNKLETLSSEQILIKTDEFGRRVWEKRFQVGTTGKELGSGSDAVFLSDGNFVVLSDASNWLSNESSIILVKRNPEGDILWEKAYGNASDKYVAGDFLLDDEGNLVVIGSKTDPDDPNLLASAVLFKINADNGNVIWENVYSAENASLGGSYIVQTDDHYVFTGSYRSLEEGSEPGYYFLQIGKDGSEQSRKQLPADSKAVLTEMRYTRDGGFAFSGYTLTDEKGTEGYLLKVDQEGDYEFSNSFGTMHIDRFFSMVESADGGYLCIGHINQFFSFERVYEDLWLLKTDDQGGFLWEKRFGGELDDYGQDIIKTTAGGYAIIGQTGSFMNSSALGHGAEEHRIYFIHVNADGDVVTKVEKKEHKQRPEIFTLLQNYPNPFNPQTWIRYQLVQDQSRVTLEVHDARGRKITTLLNAQQPAGEYKVNFDASELPSGLYFCRLNVDGRVENKKMLLIH